MLEVWSSKELEVGVLHSQKNCDQLNIASRPMAKKPRRGGVSSSPLPFTDRDSGALRGLSQLENFPTSGRIFLLNGQISFSVTLSGPLADCFVAVQDPAVEPFSAESKCHGPSLEWSWVCFVGPASGARWLLKVCNNHYSSPFWQLQLRKSNIIPQTRICVGAGEGARYSERSSCIPRPLLPRSYAGLGTVAHSLA
jgi:hypothetical protein